MKNTALVLIDIQNIYFTKGDYLLFKPEEAAQNAKKIIDYFRANEMPVVHVKHLFKTDQYNEKNEYLNAINDLVKPLENEKIVDKHYPNSFLQTDLLEYLKQRKVTNLVVCGMMSHMCVDTTVRACQDYGYSVTVIENACTTKDLAWNGKDIKAYIVHNAYMAGLNGMFAKVVNVDEWIEKEKGGN